ncbi:MAG: LptF/LptG family permease [Spirochaetia bacterium]|nr:LptF/LptG family permease [Spirochaetia bacterium]
MILYRLYPTILNRYILRTFFHPFLIGFIFFTFIHLLFYLKEAIKAAVEKGIPTNLIFDLLLNSMGWTLSITVPMSTLFAVIIAIGGMNSDSELTAIRAGGIAYSRIFRPFVFLGIFMTIVMLWFNLQLNPYCFGNMRSAMSAIFRYDPIAILEPGQFTTLDKTANLERHIYIESITKDKKTEQETLRNIQIRTTKKGKDKIFRLSQLIIAGKGQKIIKEASGKEVKALRLYEGYIFLQDSDSKNFQRINFHKGSMDINILEPEDYKEHNDIKNIQAMNLSELLHEITKLKKIALKNKRKDENGVRKAYLELHKRIALSFAAFSFMYLGFPLSITHRRSGKGMGLGISIIFIFLYYILFLGADSIIVKFNNLPVFIAAWAANFVNILIGLYFFKKKIY